MTGDDMYYTLGVDMDYTVSGRDKVKFSTVSIGKFFAISATDICMRVKTQSDGKNAIRLYDNNLITLQDNTDVDLLTQVNALQLEYI